jgi:hypothetical protein
VAERARVREIDDDEGRRLLRIIRRGTGSVVTWRRAQMVLLSAQSMPVVKIADVTFTSADRVRDVIHNFNADGFDSLYPKYKGGRPATFTLRPRRRAAYNRDDGVRHLFAACDLTRDRLFGHVKTRKRRTQFLEFCRYLRSLYPPDVRIAIVCGNYSPHLSTRVDQRVGDWAAASNAEVACTPTNSSWLNRIPVNRSPVHRPALLRPGRHRPPQPQSAGQHDPPLHHLAEPPAGGTRLRQVAARASVA